MDCIYQCNCLQIISFPNATQINFDKYSCTEIHVKSNVCFSGYERAIQIYKEHIKYIFNPPEAKNRIKRVKPAKSFKPKISKSNPIITKQQNKSDSSIKNEQLTNREAKLIDYIRSIEKRLRKYEKVIPFDPKNLDLNDFTFNENVNKSYQYDRFFIDDDDEKQQKNVSKIGEGNSCVAFKVIDHRTKQVLCKKIIKNNEFDGFNELKKKIKELEILQKNSHPCICEMICANLQEKCNEKDGDDEYTTAAFFFEYLPYSLKELIENNSLNNTLKTKIALEVAFGMSFIHKQKQIHRNLNVDNIRLNCVFESEIINFSQVHVSDFFLSNKTLTKLIGTFAIMSLEMAREEDYDEKTDVYSYGVVLYFIFDGRLPKQSMSDKINKKKIKFPKPSQAISQQCLDLIKKCMSNESKDRPSFDDIINEIYSVSFELACDFITKLDFNFFIFLLAKKI